ncbi:hypothetical protein [Undibacterium curvum]|uniref:Uncharacterized protein n=1 Tax=Undibacterium curvum TaxID=2762294 RepID=A0ABR7A0D6_9BURK|nr:hypothetical protein [Undibacterium curvum]MBC3930374.1 hypothetical protein [Undibacterium curvum]
MKAIKSSNQKTSIPQLENSVVAISRAVFVLELVNESNLDQLADSIEKLVKASYADGAVDISIFVSYANLHALKLDGFFGANYQNKLTRDLPVEIRYLFISDQDGLHVVSPMSMHYVIKYEINSVTP